MLTAPENGNLRILEGIINTGNKTLSSPLGEKVEVSCMYTVYQAPGMYCTYDSMKAFPSRRGYFFIPLTAIILRTTRGLARTEGYGAGVAHNKHSW